MQKYNNYIKLRVICIKWFVVHVFVTAIFSFFSAKYYFIFAKRRFTYKNTPSFC